jgi:hypothetical protein
MWSAAGGELAAPGPSFAFAGYTDVTWPDDQWGKITMRNATAGEDYASIDLRLSDAGNDGDGYSCYTDGNNEFTISRWDNGASTDLQVMGSNPGDNDDFSYEVEGTTLRAYINGVQEGTNETDSTYSSGDAGCGAHFGGEGVADDWSGGTFTGADFPLNAGPGSYAVTGFAAIIVIDAAPGTFFEDFVNQLAQANHDLSVDTLNVYLSNTSPDKAADVAKADLAEIATGNGYTGPIDTQQTFAEASGVGTITGTKIVIIASGGSIAQFTYLVLYNDSTTSPLDALICWWDFGAIDLADGESVTFLFNNGNPTGTIFTVT